MDGMYLSGRKGARDHCRQGCLNSHNGTCPRVPSHLFELLKKDEADGPVHIVIIWSLVRTGRARIRPREGRTRKPRLSDLKEKHRGTVCSPGLCPYFLLITRMIQQSLRSLGQQLRYLAPDDIGVAEPVIIVIIVREICRVLDSAGYVVIARIIRPTARDARIYLI